VWSTYLPIDIIDLPSIINNIAHFSQCFQAKMWDLRTGVKCKRATTRRTCIVAKVERPKRRRRSREAEDKEELEKVHEAATWRQQTKAEADAVERSLIKGGGGLKGGFRKGE